MPFQASKAKLRLFIRCLNWQHKTVGNRECLRVTENNATIPFRSTFRDWAADEAHTFQNETIELALAHTIKNQAEAAYRRGDQLERRRELMANWGNYIEQRARG